MTFNSQSTKTTKFILCSNVPTHANGLLPISWSIVFSKCGKQCPSLLTPEKLIFSWTGLLETADEVLHEFYIHEQLNQMNSASLVHSAFSWYSLSRKLNKVSELLSEEEKSAFNSAMDSRGHKYKSSQVTNLCFALWPVSKISEEQRFKVAEELENFINKQYHCWVGKFRTSVEMSPKYGNSKEDQREFTIQCMSEMELQLSSGTQKIRDTKDWFAFNQQELVAKFKAKTETGELALKREGRKKQHKSDVATYWDSLSTELPHLQFLSKLFLKCSSSEAEVERVFSHELFVHSIKRNRLKNSRTKEYIKRNYYLTSPLMPQKEDLSDEEDDEVVSVVLSDSNSSI